MIKRRFYREEHGDRDEPSSASSSSSSSSSSDSEVEVEPTEESEDHSEGVELKQNDESSSGYESENSSAHEINADSSDFTNEDDGSGGNKHNLLGHQLSGRLEADILKEEISGGAQKELVPAEMSELVLKFKSVYKCRICPRIVCLTEETMRTHLNSKRHARSEKLLKENRLKAMLNSDGEIENQETPAEMHARILALSQSKSKNKNKGRQRQKKRSRKKKNVPESEKSKESVKTPAKKRHKSEK